MMKGVHAVRKASVKPATIASPAAMPSDPPEEIEILNGNDDIEAVDARRRSV